MKIQLITIGNELLNGKIQDKNAYWLARFCHEHSLELTKNQIIPDSEAAFMLAMEEAWRDADLVVTSGGLGPTKDDLTKPLAAKYFKRALKESAQALEVAQRNYAQKNREYNPAMEYSKIPEGFEAIYNAAGYAPGLVFKNDDKMLAVLPGVPAEFNRMFTEEIYPRANALFGDSSSLKKHVIVKTWRMPEAKIFTSLCPGLWEKLESFGQVSSLPHPLGVDIGVMVEAPDKKGLALLEQEVIETVFATPLKEFIWHVGSESIEEVIVAKASAKNLTIGFAESCTGGLCASRITDVAGSSAVIYGSIVSYANSVKNNVLNVSESILNTVGPVSEECALEMAKGAREVLGVNIAVSTTGLAGPGVDGNYPVGTVGIGVSSAKGSSVKMHHFPEMERMDMKRVFSQIALYTLLEEINKA